MTTLHRPRSILVVLGALLLLVLATPTADARMPYTTPYRVGGPITLDTNLRSTSGASAWAINEFLASATSLPPLGAAFIGAERTFGVNARFLLAAAMHESGWGSSDIARVKHNLFGYNAYDRDPFRYASAYRTFAANIDATAKFIRDFYLTPGGRWWGGAPTLRAMQQYWSSSQKWGVSISRLASSIILPAIRGRSLDFATPVVGDQPRSGDRTTVLLAWAGGTVPSGVDFVATWIPVERAAGPAAPAAGGGLQGVAVPAAIGAMEGAAPSPSSPSAVERPAPAGAPFAAAASRQRSAARSVTLDVPTPGQPGAYTLRVDMRDADGSPLPAAQRVSIPDAEVRVLGDLEVRVDIVPSPDGDGAAILVTNTGRDAIPAAAAAPAQTPDASAVGEDGSASSRTVVSVAAAPGPADGPLVPLLSEALVDDLQPGATVAFPVTGVSARTGRTVNWLSVSVSALGDPTPSAPDAPSGAWLVSTNAAATAGPPRPEAALYPAPPVALAALYPAPPVALAPPPSVSPLATAALETPAGPGQPNPAASPATPRPSTAPEHSTRRYAETSGAIAYHGSWGSASGAYMGGRAAYATAPGASATLTFTGTSVRWIGPVGPTRGAAEVLVDGTAVARVNLWRASFAAQTVLFQRTFQTAGRHTLTIRVLPDPGHPYVAIDGFVVRT